jgi:hypothetical protein
MSQDLYTYRAIRQTYLKQRKFYLTLDRTRDYPNARRDRIKAILGRRRKYAPKLVNGSCRYDVYGSTY